MMHTSQVRESNSLVPRQNEYKPISVFLRILTLIMWLHRVRSNRGATSSFTLRLGMGSTKKSMERIRDFCRP